MQVIDQPTVFTVALTSGGSLTLPADLIEEGRTLCPGKTDREILAMVRSCPPVSISPDELLRTRLGEKAYEAQMLLHEIRVTQLHNGAMVNIMCPNCGGDIREGGWFALYETKTRGDLTVSGTLNTNEILRVPCPVCAPHKRATLPTRFTNCGVDPDLVRELADLSYKPWAVPGRAIHEKPIFDVLAAAQRGEPLNGWITLASAFGTGKTRLVEWLTVRLNMAHVPALLVTPLALQTMLKGREEVDSESGLSDRLQRLIDAPVLIVDNPDLLYVETNDGKATYTANQATLLLNERYIRRGSSMTIFTLNLDPRRAPAGHPLAAIFNRMFDGTLAVIPDGEGENVRLRLRNLTGG